MPKVIELKDIQNAITTNSAKWVIMDNTMPQSRHTQTSSRNLQFYLKCGICERKTWVSYTNLRKGTSKNCQKCSKLPSMEKIKALIAKYDQLWIPTLMSKTVNKHRQFWMKCGGCKNNFWVRWRDFSQGRCVACHSCASRRAHGSLKDPTKYYKHPLMKAWRRMGTHAIKKKDARGWVNFEAFKEWTLKQGVVFAGEPVLMKKDKSKPFSPENCYWKHMAETGKNTIRIGGY